MSPATGPTPPGSPLTPGSLRMQAVGKMMGILLLVVVLLGGMLYYLDARKTHQDDQRANTKQHVLLRPRDEANDWRAKEGGRVEELNRQIEALQHEVRNMKEQEDRDRNRQANTDTAPTPAPRTRPRSDGGIAPPPPALKDILPPLPGEGGSSSATGGRPGRNVQMSGPAAGSGKLPGPSTPLPGPTRSPVPGVPESPEGLPGLGTPSTPPGGASPFSRPSQGSPRQSSATSLGSDTGKIRAITPRTLQGQRSANALQTEKVGWLPSGSMIPGVLLTGVDAATGQGNAQPYPVLIRLTDTAILPNSMSMDVIGCTLVGAAVGDLASERVSIRTEGLACLLRRDLGLVTIDGDFRAAIVGPDGKLAIRGRVVQKEGAIIARALTAGFVSGLSEAFKPRISYTPYTFGGTSADVNNNSSFTLPPPQDLLTAAGLSGVGKSMELLAKYYLSLAEQIHPVIEIQAGTPVDIMVLKGIALRWRSSAPMDTTPTIIE
jgi:hypothetical protein